MCKMSSILETLKFMLLLIYYYFEVFVMKFCRAPKNVAGEIVLVTGSANGIGKQIALNFARLGAILILWDIDEQGNEDTAELMKRNGALAVYTYKCDCSKREEIYAVADQVKKEVGDVNILINNAGILNGKNFIDLLDSEIEETLDVNIKAHFWTCKAFLPAMISCNHGHLVTISSTGGLTGANKLSDYCASKWAETGFLEAVAFELQAAGKKGIKTTIVFPYYVDTEMVTGVITTRPCLYPILDVEYVGRKIVDAILKEKFYLFIPPWVCFATLKIFLPTKVIFLLVEYFGIFNNLDHFKGRKKRKGNKN
ncbi:epidermal retinol dehydrogenase 2-like [Eublepharis macularius]|uniref:Epidermal retinol dehydrogenase 2-like n=1 Tax=Eublepharis macularius TaxID=481883 RepID=A0AA97L6E9_EUBMA|nr:epidermal retinol dehydrogenase 2-like [Eublepharis macularius]